MVGDGDVRRQADVTLGWTVLPITENIAVPLAEFEWQYARSGGPGGQNVNKVSSKAVLRWAMATSPSVPPEVKARMMAAHPSHVTTEGEFFIASQTYRDQERNREACLTKLAAMLRKAATPPTPRKKTKPSKSSKKRRLADKKHNSSRKSERKVGGED